MASLDQTSAKALVDSASPYVLYEWVQYSLAPYSPAGESNGNWHYRLYRLGDSVNYALFEAYKANYGLMYRYDYSKSRWYKFAGTAV